MDVDDQVGDGVCVMPLLCVAFTFVFRWLAFAVQVQMHFFIDFLHVPGRFVLGLFADDLHVDADDQVGDGVVVMLLNWCCVHERLSIVTVYVFYIMIALYG